MLEKSKKNIASIKIKKGLLDLFSTFYAKIYILETLLKYKLIQQLEKQYGSNWLESLVTQVKLFSDESEIISKRKKNDFKTTTRLFIHEASFGFWVELFGRKPYKELKGLPIKAFEKTPKEVKRNDLYRMLTNIKELRNNLYHHRINLSGELKNDDIKNLRDVNNDLLFIIGALDKNSLSLIDIGKFEKKLSKISISKIE